MLPQRSIPGIFLTGTDGEVESTMKKQMETLKGILLNFIAYLPLLGNLVSRELKRKYRQSALGYIWCVLNPLGVMFIMYLVFSTMFHNRIENFPVYLFAGRMMFSLVTDGSGGMLRSFVRNGALMRKARIPYYIFPMSVFLSAVVNFFFQLIAFAIVLLATRTPLTVHVLAFPAVFLQAALFTFGLGLFLAHANTFIRDTEYLYSVFLTAWVYLTPLFYPLSALPGRMQYLISHFNPTYFYAQQARDVFLYHQWPETALLVRGFAAGILALAVGLSCYQRRKDSIILYV